MPEPYALVVRMTDASVDPGLSPEGRRAAVMRLAADVMAALDRYTGQDAEIVSAVARRRIGDAQREVGLQ